MIFQELRSNFDTKENLGLEDLFITVYCLVDDSYKLLFEDERNLRRSNNNMPCFGDSEVITLAIVAEMMSCDSHKAWISFVRKNYLSLFHNLLDRTRYGKRLAQLNMVIEKVRRHILFLLNADLTYFRLIDSFPIKLCHLQRLSSSSRPFEYVATVGYCLSRKEYYYGMKGHVLTTLDGIPIDWILTPAHVHDTDGFHFLLEEMIQRGTVPHRISVFGDKGFVGREYVNQIKPDFGVDLVPQPRHYKKELYPESGLSFLVKTVRKIIETTFGVLTGVLNASRTWARTVSSLVRRMNIKMLACNIAKYLNRLFGEPPLAIKAWVF